MSNQTVQRQALCDRLQKKIEHPLDSGGLEILSASFA